jgi:hypothetical protein
MAKLKPIRWKPCPSCGSRAVFNGLKTVEVGGAFVCCSSADCWIRTFAMPTDEKAIAAWNRRVKVKKAKKARK